MRKIKPTLECPEIVTPIKLKFSTIRQSWEDENKIKQKLQIAISD